MRGLQQWVEQGAQHGCQAQGQSGRAAALLVPLASRLLTQRALKLRRAHTPLVLHTGAAILTREQRVVAHICCGNGREKGQHV